MKKTSRRIIIIVTSVTALSGVVAAKTGWSANSQSNSSLPAVAAVPATAKLPKLLDLGATKCIPCKMMAPVLEKLRKDYAGRLEVEFIDVWQDPAAAKQYKIEVIPTQIFYSDAGKELFRHVGFYGREDILAKWKELEVDLNRKPDATEPMKPSASLNSNKTKPD